MPFHQIPSNVHNIWSDTRIIEKGNLFDFVTIFTRLTCNEKLHWTESQLVVKDEQRVVVVSGNMGLVPLIGPKTIRDRASDRSAWSEKGPRI